MTLLSRKVDYALLILAYLHRHAGGGCAREIAARYGLSRAFVANILKVLCHKGFVTSHRGVKGGYALARPADAVRLADLMEALDDRFQLAECNHETAADHCTLTGVCPLRGGVAEVHRRIREVLSRVTLAELFNDAPNRGREDIGLGLLAVN